MKKEIADMWCAALQSGEYNQGRGTLCLQYSNDTKAWCCLGVLCDLYNKHNPPMKVNMLSGSGGKYVSFNQYSTKLPPEVCVWSGMTSTNGKRTGFRVSLVTLNDHCGYSFAEIANVIEKNWETL